MGNKTLFNIGLIKNTPHNVEAFPVNNSNKVLLLGSGDTGKSTFYKHAKMISGKPYSTEEAAPFRETIFRNIVRYTKSLCEYIENNKLPHKLSSQMTTFKGITDEELIYIETLWRYPELIRQIKIVWESEAVQTLLLDRHKLFNNFSGDALAHYISQIDKMNNKWFPTQQDILHSRIKTFGITESFIQVDDIELTLTDVGGQRSERKRWIHTFEDVKCIIYFAPLIEYATLCIEDGKTNRAMESLNLFKEVVNSKWFIGVPFILVFSKSDLLELTMRRCAVSSTFKEFTGNNNDLNQVVMFIKDMFLAQYSGQDTNKILPIMINLLDEEMVRDALQIIADVTKAGDTIGHNFKLWMSPRTLFTIETLRRAKLTDVAIICE